MDGTVDAAVRASVTDLLPVWISAGLFMVIVMSTAWWVQIKTGQGGWADAFWSLGTGLAGVGVCLIPFGSDGPATRQIVAALLIGLWGLRLGTHIARRAASESDDARYAKLREEWGASHRIKMFGFLMLQAGAATLLLLSVLVAAHNPASHFGIMDLLGVAVFVIALGGEALADHQLKAFKQANTTKGQVCDRGLWAWSRHPNYFFEWLGWCAWPLFAIRLTDEWLWGWLALIAPIYIYWLLNHVSGVPLLEAHMKRTRPEAFEQYARRTSRFFLRPPRA